MVNCAGGQGCKWARLTNGWHAPPCGTIPPSTYFISLLETRWNGSLRDLMSTPIRSRIRLNERGKSPLSWEMNRDLKMKLGVQKIPGNQNKISQTDRRTESPPFSDLLLSPFPDLYVTCQVYAGNQPLTVMLKTSYKPMSTKFA